MTTRQAHRLFDAPTWPENPLDPDSPTGHRAAVDRRALIALLTGVVVALLFAAIATAGKVQFADRDPSFPWHPTLDSPVTTIEPGPPVTTEPVEYDPVQVPRVVEVLLRALVYGGVAVVAFLFLSNVWRHRPRRQWRRMRRRRRRSVQFDVLDDVAAVLNADADAQRAALQRGSPRNAIVECWLRLEAAVVAAGVARDPADTSTELTVRVLATYHVDPVAIERLAALYREARFSDHPMGEDARRAAIEALDDVHDGLRTDRTTLVETA